MELGYHWHWNWEKIHTGNREIKNYKTLKYFFHSPVICWEITKIHQSCSLERHSAKQTQKVTFPIPVHLASSLSRDLICLLGPQFSWGRNRKMMYISITCSSGGSCPPSGAPWSYLIMKTSTHPPLLQHEPRNQVTAVVPPFVFGFLSDLLGKPWTGQNLRRMLAIWFYPNLV